MATAQPNWNVMLGRLDDERFGAAWAAGRSAPLEQVVTQARSLDAGAFART